jgi:hypothetical protein
MRCPPVFRKPILGIFPDGCASVASGVNRMASARVTMSPMVRRFIVTSSISLPDARSGLATVPTAGIHSHMMARPERFADVWGAFYAQHARGGNQKEHGKDMVYPRTFYTDLNVLRLLAEWHEVNLGVLVVPTADAVLAGV